MLYVGLSAQFLAVVASLRLQQFLWAMTGSDESNLGELISADEGEQPGEQEGADHVDDGDSISSSAEMRCFACATNSKKEDPVERKKRKRAGEKKDNKPLTKTAWGQVDEAKAEDEGWKKYIVAGDAVIGVGIATAT